MRIDLRRRFNASALFLLLLVIHGSGARPIVSEQAGEDFRTSLQSAADLERDARWEEAREIYLDLGKRYPTNRSVLYGLDRVHRTIEDDGRYLRFLRENYRRYPGDVVLFRQYLDLSARSGETGSIGPDIRLFITSRKKVESTYRSLYSILLPLHLDDLIESVLAEGEEELADPDLFSRELSDLYHRTARYEESLAEAMNALGQNPKSLSFVKKRIGSLRKVMSDKEIIRMLEAYGDRHERAIVYLDLLSWFHVESGDPRKALPVLKEMSGRNFEAGVSAMNELAKSCEAEGFFDAGIEIFGTLGSLDPEGKERYELEAARLYRQAGEPERAGRMYRSVLENEPDTDTMERIRMSLGEIALYDLDRPGEAAEWFDRAVEGAGDPKRSIEARLMLIRALVVVGDLARAGAEGERALQIESVEEQRPEIEYFRGVIALLGGRIDEGKEILEKVSRRSAHLRSNDALEVLTWLEKDTSRGQEVSLGLIEHRFTEGIGRPDRRLDRLAELRKIAEGSTLAPDVAYILAIQNRKMGEPERAIELLEEISATWSSHRIVAEVRWEMADIYRRDLGDRKAAKEILEQVVLDHGDSIVAPRARRDLEELAAEKGESLI